MTGRELRKARRQKCWTQQEAAQRLGVSQPYLSLLERGRRHVPTSHLQDFHAVYEVLSPVVLPFHGEDKWHLLDNQQLAAELASLGYPGFSYMRKRPAWNPAELLVAALTRNDLETRVAEALPWLALVHSNMDWDWVVSQAKLRDVQNRLGFLLALAREVAGRRGANAAAKKLGAVEVRLQNSVLLQKQTFCHEDMSQAERRWLENKSTPEARRWNVLSDLSPDHLTYAVTA